MGSEKFIQRPAVSGSVVFGNYDLFPLLACFDLLKASRFGAVWVTPASEALGHSPF
jgi:hypothetical protein